MPVDPNYQPAVAVLIPAYNEEKVIERTVRSVLDSDYPNLRAIVIDDGSKDATLEVCREAFRKEIADGRVTVLTKPNSGKADALNFGLEHVTEEIFVGIDADTIIAPDAISKLVPHFRDPRVAAMAGNAKVGNRVNLWTRWQALEYITSQNFERRALNTLNAVSVVPGAIGAWRTADVRAAGGYHHDTVAEDADLTMALLQAGYRVNYEDRALAYTEAPTTANGLMRQRFRWSFGIMQAVWKHKAAMKRKGALGWVALPNVVIFQILLPLVSPFIDIMFVVGAITLLHQQVLPSRVRQPGRLPQAGGVLRAVHGHRLHRLGHRVCPGAPAARTQARLPAAGPRLAAALRLSPVVLDGAVQDPEAGHRGGSFAWDKLERTATVRQPVAVPQKQGEARVLRSVRRLFPAAQTHVTAKAALPQSARLCYTGAAMFRANSLSCLRILLLATRGFGSAYQASPSWSSSSIIDQFRGDYLERYHDEFGPSGFRMFTDRGAYFPACYYDYANTRTAPGHATIGTGTYTPATAFSPTSGGTPRRSAWSAAWTTNAPSSSASKATPWRLAAQSAGRHPRRRAAAGDARAIARLWHRAERPRRDPSHWIQRQRRFWIDHASGAWVTSTYYMSAPRAGCSPSTARAAKKYLNLDWKDADGTVLASTAPHDATTASP